MCLNLAQFGYHNDDVPSGSEYATSHGQGMYDNGHTLCILQAINYVASRNQTTASRYPYTSGGGSTGTCNNALVATTPSGQAVKLSGTARVVSPARSEAALMAAVAIAPTTIYFDAEYSFQMYAGGVQRIRLYRQDQPRHGGRGVRVDGCLNQQLLDCS